MNSSQYEFWNKKSTPIQITVVAYLSFYEDINYTSKLENGDDVNGTSLNLSITSPWQVEFMAKRFMAK